MKPEIISPEILSLAEEKARLRRAVLARRDALSLPLRRAAALQLAAPEALAMLAPFLPDPGAAIAAYWPIRSEIDPGPLIAALRARGYSVALPRIDGAALSFHFWPEDGLLIDGPFGTKEPDPRWQTANPALFLTPLVAFDARHHRLGYGRGYYDRAFAHWPEARRIGLAHAIQKVERVPTEDHDMPLDLVLTGGDNAA